jgi:hypothetical protein
MTTGTTIANLRPLRLAEIIDQAIHLYRQNFCKFVGIVAIIQVPYAALNLLRSLHRIEWRYYPSTTAYAISGILSLCLFLLIPFIRNTSVSLAAASSYFGQPISISDTYRKVAGRWLRLAGVFLLIFTLSIVFLLPSFIAVTIVASRYLADSYRFSILSYGTLGIFFFCWLILMPLSASITILEEQTVLRSLHRSWDLARRRFWWVVGFAALLFVLQLVIFRGENYLVSQLLLTLEESIRLAMGLSGASIFLTVIQSLATLIVELLYRPLESIAITLMYLDLRVRTEGLDLLLRAEEGNSNSDRLESIKRHAPLPNRGAILTWAEVGSFILITIAGFALSLSIGFISSKLAGLGIWDTIGL